MLFSCFLDAVDYWSGGGHYQIFNPLQMIYILYFHSLLVCQLPYSRLFVSSTVGNKYFVIFHLFKFGDIIKWDQININLVLTDQSFSVILAFDLGIEGFLQVYRILQLEFLF